jgi:hypothetical protein
VDCRFFHAEVTQDATLPPAALTAEPVSGDTTQCLALVVPWSRNEPTMRW